VGSVFRLNPPRGIFSWEGNRRRYYCILLQPGLFEISLQRQWGRLRSKKLRVRDESFGDLDLAIQRANRLYKERLRRGYREF